MSLVRPHRPAPSAVAGFGAVALVALMALGGSGAMMAALPAALLALAILFRRFSGDEILVRLARRPRVRPRRAGHSPSPRFVDAVRIGLLPLLAAVRPLRGPPLLSSHSI